MPTFLSLNVAAVAAESIVTVTVPTTPSSVAALKSTVASLLPLYGLLLATAPVIVRSFAVMSRR